MSGFPAVENGPYVKGRVGIFGENEWSRRRMRMEFRRVAIGFEKRDVEDGVKTGEVRGETELVDKVGELSLYGEGTETNVVEFVGRTGSFNFNLSWPCGKVKYIMNACTIGF